MKWTVYLVLIYLFVNSIYAQNEKRVNGKVIVSNATASRVLVFNLTNSQETVTDINGTFSITAQLGDLLLFHADHLDNMRKLIDAEALEDSLLEIPMTSKIVLLEEVTINTYAHINAFNLGITATDIKTLSPAERGKYSNEPKAAEYELNLRVVQKLENTYSDAFFEKLSIEKKMIKGFLFFAVEQPAFLRIATSKNQFITSLHLINYSHVYNELRKSKQPDLANQKNLQR